MCVVGEEQGLLLGEVLLAGGAKDSARSHLIWRDGYQEPLGFPRVSTLSSTLSVLLELATGKGLRHPSSPSTSLSHCHQLFISPDTRPPQQGRLVSSPRPALPKPHCHRGPVRKDHGQPSGGDLAEGLEGWPCRILLEITSPSPSPANPPVSGSPWRRCPSRSSVLCHSPLERRPPGPWEMFGVPISGSSETTQNQKRRKKKRKNNNV